MNLYAAYHALSPGEQAYYEGVARQSYGDAWVQQFKQYYQQFKAEAEQYQQQQAAGGGGSAAGQYANAILGPAAVIGAKKAGQWVATQLVGEAAAEEVSKQGLEWASQNAADQAAWNAGADAATNASNASLNSTTATTAGVTGASAAAAAGQTAASAAAGQAAANAAGIGATANAGLSSGAVEGLNAVASGPTIDAANLSANASAQAGAEGGSSLAANAAPVLQGLGAAAAGYTLYRIGENWGAGDRHAGRTAMTTGSAALAGSYLGSFAGPIGAIVGGVLGAAYGFAAQYTKSGKHKDQKKRDGVRAGLEEIGFAEQIDGSHHVRLMDGGMYDIGRELEEIGVMGDTYNIDLTDPQARRVAGLLTPLAVLLTGTDPDDHHLAGNLAGYLTNAAMTQGDPLAQAKQFYEQLGIDHATGFAMLTKMAQEGKIDNESHVFMNDGLNQLFDPNYTPEVAQEWWMAQPDIPEYAKTIDGQTHPLAGTKGNQAVLDANAPQRDGYVSRGPSQEAQQAVLDSIAQADSEAQNVSQAPAVYDPATGQTQPGVPQQPGQAPPIQAQQQPPELPAPIDQATQQPEQQTFARSMTLPQGEDEMSFQMGLQRLGGAPGYKPPQQQSQQAAAPAASEVQPIPRPTTSAPWPAMPGAQDKQAHGIDLSFLPEQYREQVQNLFTQKPPVNLGMQDGLGNSNPSLSNGPNWGVNNSSPTTWGSNTINPEFGIDPANAPQWLQGLAGQIPQAEQKYGGFANSLPPYMGVNDFYKEINQREDIPKSGPMMSFGGFMGGGDNRPDIQFQQQYYNRPQIDQPGPNYNGVLGHADFEGFQGGNMADAFKFWLDKNPQYLQGM